ncbi:MAG TPA: hypothetical protein VF755_23355 [Catenuloplanes sp.]|jgi:hypothetical protein
MTLNLEDLIRAAQQHQADRAVHPGRIQGALPARSARAVRHRRYGRLATTAAAVAVAAAVTVPVLALRVSSDTATSLPAAPTAAASTAPDAPQTTGLSGDVGPIPLLYRPTWLPAGYTERIRRLPLGSDRDKDVAAVQRFWTAGSVGTDGNGGAAGLSLDVRRATEATDPSTEDGEQVDVNGRPGVYLGVDGKSYLRWRPDHDTVLSVAAHRPGLSRSDLLRVARSVRPDPATMVLPLRLGWLPDGLPSGHAEVSGDAPNVWFGQISAQGLSPNAARDGKTAKLGGRSISVAAGPSTIAPGGGQRLTVAGRPARLVERDAGSGSTTMRYLVVELAGGRLLTVTGSWPPVDPLTTADLVRVAENTRLDGADQGWIRGR